MFCDLGAIGTIGEDETRIPVTYGLVGIAFTGLSWWLFDTSKFVEQEGSGVQWTLPPQ